MPTRALLGLYGLLRLRLVGHAAILGAQGGEGRRLDRRRAARGNAQRGQRRQIERRRLGRSRRRLWVSPDVFRNRRRRGDREATDLCMNLVDLLHRLSHRAGMLRALDLRECRLALEPAEGGPSVADDVPDDTTQQRSEQHRRESERLRDRPVRPDRGQGRRAEQCAEDDAAGNAPGEDRVRPAISVLGRAFEYARIEVREVLDRHWSEIGVPGIFLEYGDRRLCVSAGI
jgi:hypothetical protein